MSALFGFAPLKVEFVANQFLPPGSVVWLVDGKPVTWTFTNGKTSTEIATYPTGCFGACNTVPRAPYIFQSPGYHRVAMVCKSAGTAYNSNEQAVMVMPSPPVTAGLIVVASVVFAVLAVLRDSRRRRVAAQHAAAAPMAQVTNPAEQGSMTHRPSTLGGRTRFRFRHSHAYQASAPDSPERLIPMSAPDSPQTLTPMVAPELIQPGGGQPMTGGTVEVGARPPGPVTDLRITVTGGSVVLDWNPPDFDPNRDTLLGYQIFRMEYTGRSNAAQEILRGATPPVNGQVRWQEPYAQTAQHSTWQDVVAYVVQPLYQSSIGQTQGLQYAGPGSTALVPHA